MRIHIACHLVRKERQEARQQDAIIEIPVHGITASKLIKTAKEISTTYHARKQENLKPNFEEIVEDMVRINFDGEDTRHVVKHVLGHFFAWRRNACMPEEAHKVARELGYSFI